MKHQWTKVPSITRKGKFFHTITIGNARYWVAESTLCKRWNVQDNHGGGWGDFRTAKQAMSAVETLSR